MTVLAKRHIKCLRRIADHKSIPDLGAFDWLVERGYARIDRDPDEPGSIITVTPAGRDALAQP